MLPKIVKLERELEELLEKRNEAADRLNKMDSKIDKIEKRVAEIQDKCEHDPTRIEGYIICKKCNVEVGRWCETAPDHMCEFEDDSEADNELCKYCGRPDDPDEDDEDDEEE